MLCSDTETNSVDPFFFSHAFKILKPILKLQLFEKKPNVLKSTICFHILYCIFEHLGVGGCCERRPPGVTTVWWQCGWKLAAHCRWFGGSGWRCELPAIVILLPGHFQLSYDRNAPSHEKRSSLLLLHWIATGLPESSAKAAEIWPCFPTHTFDRGLNFWGVSQDFSPSSCQETAEETAECSTEFVSLPLLEVHI